MNRKTRFKFILYGMALLSLAAVLVYRIINRPHSVPGDTQSPGLSRVIRVGIFDFEPLNFLDSNHQAKGLNVDILRDVISNEDRQIKFVYGTWAEGLERLERGEIDLMPSVAYSPERDQVLDYCREPVAELWGQVFITPESPIKNITDCDHRRIAVMKKDISAQNFIRTAESFGAQSIIVEYPSHAAAFAAVQHGEADAAVAPQHFGLRHAKQYQLTPSTIQFSPFAVYFATKQGACADLRNHLDRHLSYWKQDPHSIYYRRINHWLGSGETTGFLSKKAMLWLGGGAALVFSLIALWVITLNLMLARRTQALNQNRKNLKAEAAVTEAFIQSMPGYFFLCSAQGRYIRWNENLRNRLCTEEKEMQDCDILDLAIDSDRKRLQEAWTNCILSGTETVEISSEKNPNSEEYQRLLVTLTRIEINQQTCLIGTAVDITGQQQAQADLAEARRAAFNMMEDALLAKQRLEITQLALDYSADAVFWVEQNSRFSYVNQSACRLLGYSRDELLNLSVYDIDRNYPAEKMQEAFQQVERNGTLDVESVLTAKDGRKIPVEIHDSLIQLEHRSFICAFAHDISERKRMQDAIQKRILSLTRPLEDSQGIAFEELFDLKEIQRIQDEFAAATGVASIITQPDGTPITKASNFTCLCNDIIRKTEKGCSNCFKSDAAIGRYHPEGPIIQPCLSGGLWDAGVSITVGDRHIANWLIGQVRNETQTDEHMRAYAREIGADERTFMDAFYRVPVMSQDHFEKIAKALFTLANQLSTSAYLNLQQARFIAEEAKNKERLTVLSAVVEQSPEAILIRDTRGINVYVNPAYTLQTGYTADEMIGKKTSFSDRQGEPPEFFENIQKTLHSGKTWSGHLKIIRKDGSRRTLEAVLSPVKNQHNQIINFVGIQRDVTEDLAREEQFRQAQKMEAVGQLAGGVAHDFNNILQAILGFSEILMEQLPKDSLEQRNVIEIDKAARRAAELTRQLLTFSRKQPTDRKLIDLNQTVRDSEVLLHMLMGDKIPCVFRLAPETPPVYADTSQITQIIMNLAVNARDAMPDGGQLTLSTETVVIDAQAASEIADVEPGSFVCITVTDTGTGMSPEVKARLFEPFFTTKSVGKGTGLGLAVVYGIVKQNKGWIQVDSHPGEGTTFKIYLPARAPSDPVPIRSETITERILLVDDDLDTRNMVLRILSSANYRVAVASSAEEALSIFGKNPNEIDMLFSDIMLPGESGIELADRIRKQNPALPVLLYSGYRDPHERWKEIESKGYDFLQKPFSITGLLATIHDVLIESKY